LLFLMVFFFSIEESALCCLLVKFAHYFLLWIATASPSVAFCCADFFNCYFFVVLDSRATHENDGVLKVAKYACHTRHKVAGIQIIK